MRMTAKRKSNLPVILMALSLLLLAVFEIFWLKSEYEDQKEWLKIEQSHFFLFSDTLVGRLSVQ